MAGSVMGTVEVYVCRTCQLVSGYVCRVGVAGWRHVKAVVLKGKVRGAESRSSSHAGLPSVVECLGCLYMPFLNVEASMVA